MTADWRGGAGVGIPVITVRPGLALAVAVIDDDIVLIDALPPGAGFERRDGRHEQDQVDGSRERQAVLILLRGDELLQQGNG